MRKVAIGALVALTWLLVGMTTNSSQAATLRFGGSVGYSYSGSYATLTADHIYNYTTSGYSNNIRMELWVFPAPYTGTQSGYKVAQYQLGQLQGGYEYYSINSGAVPFSYPPNGTWYPSMFLMEYDGTANTNNGFTTRDWVNLSPALQIGAVVTPGQLAVPSSYAFGAQTAGTSGPAQALTMTNIGGAAVTILGISSSLPVEFNVNWGNCPTSLNPGASCTFYVTFRPAQIGSKSAVITVQDSGINSPHYVSLSGTGTAPAPPPGQLSVQGAVAYGNQTVGTTSGSTTLTVTNTGGTAVSVSAINSSNPSEFPVTGTSCAVVNAGATCTFTFVFTPNGPGARSGTISILNNGATGTRTVSVTGTGVAAAPPTGSTINLIEYYHASFDHYFVTAVADEIAKLDNGTFAGWVRTGYEVSVYALGTPGTSATCRFFSAAFAPKSSHFYTPYTSECTTVQSNPNWQFEGQVFGVLLPDGSGNCAAGTVPLYRVYNNGQGAAPNHRYTTSASVRDVMVAKGWIREGNGSAGVIACVPQQGSPSAPSTPEGMWYGSTSRGNAIIGAVLDTGAYYVIYNIPGTNTIGGVVQGDMTWTNTTFASSNARDFAFATPYGVYAAQFSGTYVPKATFSAAVNESGVVGTVSATYQSTYDQPASTALASGTYSGSVGSTLGWQSAVVTVGASGTISGNNFGCPFSGSVSPHGQKNIFDLMVTFGGGTCLFGTATVRGIAYFDTAAKMIYAFAPNASRTDAFIYVGTKP